MLADSDADGEWSEDEAVKSGSATAMSDTDFDERVKLADETILTLTPSAGSVDAILNKIDAELYTLHTKQVLEKPSGLVKTPTNAKPLYIVTAQLDQSQKGLSPGDSDTGLGSLPSDTSKILTEASLISEEKNKEFNCLVAKEVDLKFQEVLNRKKGLSVEDLPLSAIQSDQETIKTEDFEKCFNEILVPPKPTLDNSIKDGTFDLEAKFEKAFAKLTESSPRMSERPRRLHQRSYSGSALDLSQPPLGVRMPRKASPGRKKKGKEVPQTTPGHGLPPASRTAALLSVSSGAQTFNSSGYNSDQDSIRTEDFEAIFQKLLVKQGGTLSGAPHLTFDPKAMAASLEANSNLTAILKKRGKNNQVTTTGGKSKMEADLEQMTFRSKGEKVKRSDKEGHSVYQEETDRSVPAENQADGQTDGQEQTDEEIARNSAEIERESIRIQKELEFERKFKKAPQAESHLIKTPKTVQFKGPGQRPDRPGQSLEDKQYELETLEKNITNCRADLKQLEALLRDSQQRAESARTQLMLMEFKRENVCKELDRTAQELDAKRQKVKDLDGEVKSKMEVVQELASIGVTTEQVRELLNRSRHVEALELERDELVRQGESTREELFALKKKSRAERELLTEEADAVKIQLEEVVGERDQLHQRVVTMEITLQKVETQMSSLSQENQSLRKEAEEMSNEAKLNLQRQAMQDNEEQESRFEEMASRTLKLEGDVRLRDDAINSLRGQLESAAIQLLEEERKRELVQTDHRQTLQALRKETDMALTQLKESCFLEKQQALENLRDQLREEQRGALVKTEDRMTRSLAHLEKSAAEKDDRIEKLEEELRQTNEATRQQIEKIKETNTEEARAMIRKERQILENERDWIRKREREDAMSESTRKVTSMAEELKQKEAQIKQMLDQIENLKKELERERDSYKQIVRDKLFAVARAKDQAKSELQAQLDILRETLIKENKSEMEKLRVALQSQGEELSKLRQQRLTNEKKDREKSSALDRTERTLITEINEECRRTATILGLSPRTINISSYRDGDNSQLPHKGQGRKLITSALANLRACNEELRCHVTNMSQSLESQRAATQQAIRDKETTLDQVKKKMEREKLQELDALKDRLIKEHAKQQADSFIHPKMAEYDNNRPQQDMRQIKQMEVQRDLEQANSSQHREIERLEREVTRLAMQMSPPMQPVISPHNILADAFELRAKSAEKEAELAESRANRNGAMLTQKMAEMNKLQSTLNNQSKELRQLKRAYNQLPDHSRLTRAATPTSHAHPQQTPPSFSGLSHSTPQRPTTRRPLSLSAI